MTIGIFARKLYSGGTERVIANLSCIWSSLGHRIVFFTQFGVHDSDFAHECVVRVCTEHGAWADFDADALQSRYGLDLAVFNGVWNNDEIELLVRRFHERRVRTMAIIHHAFDNWLFSGANVGDWSKDGLLPCLDYLVCVDKLQALWWSHRHPRVFCVPNPISVAEAGGASVPGDPRAMVWVGRAEDWGKRVELAMQVLAHVRKSIPDATLTVVGSLPEGKRLKADGLRCTGYVADPARFVMAAGVNLFTSLWEVAVPQVILEASALGVPTVAFDLPVLRDEPGIYLGQTVDEVAQWIVRLMSDGSFFASVRADVAALREAVFSRNDLVRDAWREIFEAISENRVDAVHGRHVAAYSQPSVCQRLVEEIQRAEGYFVRTRYAALQKSDGWRSRIKRIGRMIGL